MRGRASVSRPSRLAHIDFLKVLGLSGILLAHIDPPRWLFMARNFDVPLMVVASAILAERSFGRRMEAGESVRSYYLARARRLVVPVWLFLAFLFAVQRLSGESPMPPGYYAASFCLTRYGIGFVWIVLVFLWVALLVPLIDRIGWSPKGWLLIAAAYASYEAALRLGIGAESKVVDSTLYYAVPYGALAYLGYHSRRMGRAGRSAVFAASLVVFVSMGILLWSRCGAPQDVQVAKYPPTLYYLSYGTCCSFGLLLLSERRSRRLFDHPFVRFVSARSMDVYLWHIFVLWLFGRHRDWRILGAWPTRFLAVFACSAALAWLQVRLVSALRARAASRERASAKPSSLTPRNNP